MSFSCTIISKNGELTGDGSGKINYKLYGLYFKNSPYGELEIRDTMSHLYEIKGEEAQYWFSRLQDMVRENLNKTMEKEHPDCPECQCFTNENFPTRDMHLVLNTLKEDIISIKGGY